MAKAKPVILYTVRSSKPHMYEVSKLSTEMEPLSAYVISEHEKGAGLTCSCPARKAWCRHCEILRLFQGEGKVNTGWMFDFDNKKWTQPNTGAEE